MYCNNRRENNKTKNATSRIGNNFIKHIWKIQIDNGINTFNFFPSPKPPSYSRSLALIEIYNMEKKIYICYSDVLN